MKKLRVGIVGMGAIFKTHYSIIHKSENAEIVGLCDIDKSKLIDYNTYPCFTNYEEMLTSTNPDVVHILTPHHCHLDMIIKANQLGINVLCEKPLVKSFQELSILEENIDLSRGKISVCLQNRYNSSTKIIKEAIDTKKYGFLQGIIANLHWNRNSDYYLESPWRGSFEKEGGGVLINQAIHTIDLVDYFAGDIKWIAANINQFVHKDIIEVEDSSNYLAMYGDDLIASVTLTNSFFKDEPVTIKFIFENAELLQTNNKLLLFQNEQFIEIPLNEVEVLPEAKQYYGTSHAKLINAFHDALINNNNNYLTYQSAKNALEIIAMIYKSDLTNQKVYKGDEL